MQSQRRIGWTDTLVLILLTSYLIRPLFRVKYLDNWSSIESTFIADARMLGARLPGPGWQPLWYCGTRFEYIYPPALRYGTALISKLPRVTPARAYHLYTAIFYVLGIVAVYWLVRIGSGSRGSGWLAAAGTALLSPSFLFLPRMRIDSPFGVTPERLHVLMGYGEGPHISAVSILPAALALSFLALRAKRPVALAGAACLCALIVANNFYGAMALAIFFPILTWAVWVTSRDRLVWLRAGGIGVLAYALSAWWLTPSYMRITAVNLGQVAEPGNTWSRVTALLVVIVFCGITWRFRRPEWVWNIFVAGACLFLSLYVLGYSYFGLRVTGNSVRLIPELDLALILGCVAIIRALWNRPKLRWLAILLPLPAAYPAGVYIQHAYFSFPKAANVENQYQFRIAKWVHDNLPGERVLPSGSVRFWFDAWFDNPQQDGGSTQGMLNQTLPRVEYQIPAGDRGDIAILWMQALGTDAVIVPDRNSPEPYHDYRRPEKFRGLAPVLYDDGHGTVIYRIPRRYSGIARVVETAKIAAVGMTPRADDADALRQYVEVVENPEQTPVSVEWKTFDDVEIDAHTSNGQSILLQETFDRAWHAFENGKPLPIRLESAMNFMLIDVPEGDHKIQMRFETPLENQIGRAISVLALAAMLALIWRGR